MYIKFAHKIYIAVVTSWGWILKVNLNLCSGQDSVGFFSGQACDRSHSGERNIDMHRTKRGQKTLIGGGWITTLLIGVNSHLKRQGDIVANSHIQLQIHNNAYLWAFRLCIVNIICRLYINSIGCKYDLYIMVCVFTYII